MSTLRNTSFIGTSFEVKPAPYQKPLIATEPVEAITDLSHPEHQNLLDWCGGAFDPKALDPDVIDRRLQLIKL